MDFKHTSIKQSALGWVKKSIDENLAAIRGELNVYIEEKDALLLQSVRAKLSDVRGVLTMIEQYGAAMLTEEMDSLCGFIAAKEEPDEQALEVFLRAVLQLPDYLEHIQAGQKDIPIAILPLLNDIRAVKNEDLFSEKLLFLPDLSMHMDDSEVDSIADGRNQASMMLARKLRLPYQYSLLGVIRDKEVHDNLKRLEKITEVMEDRSASEQIARFWWIVGALIESIGRDDLPLGVSVKMLLGKVDQVFRGIMARGEKALLRQQPIDLIKNLLYYIAQPECDGPKSQAIKTAYRLEQFLPSDRDQGQGIAGPNQELLKTVSDAVQADLEEVKSSLEVYVNGDLSRTEQLKNLPAELHIISDTLAMIGLGSQRQIIESQISVINDVIEGRVEPDQEKMLAMAAELIQVDQALELMQQGQFLSQDEDEGASSRASLNFEMGNMLNAVVTAALDDIQKIKVAILDFVKDTSKVENLDDCKALLEETRGALALLNQDSAVKVVEGLISYLDSHDLNEFMESDHLDQMSQVVVSIEYFLEAFGEQRADAETILDFANDQLDQLLAGKGIDISVSGETESETQDLLIAEEVATPQQEVPAEPHDQSAVPADLEVGMDLQTGEEGDIEDSPVEFSIAEALIVADESDVEDDAGIEINGDTGDDDLDLASFVEEEPGADEEPVDASLSVESVVEDDGALIDVASSLSDTDDDGSSLAGDEALPDEAMDSLIIEDSQFIGVINLAEEDDDDESDQTVYSLDDELGESERGVSGDLLDVEPVEDDSPVLKEGSDPEILEIYLEEAEEESEQIRQLQLDWSLHPEDENALKNIRRSFHTIKGSGRLVGAMKIGEFAWDYENLLNRVIDKTVEPSQSVIDAVGLSAKALSELVEELKTGAEAGVDVAYLRGVARALAEGKSGALTGVEAVGTASPREQGGGETDNAMSTEDDSQEPESSGVEGGLEAQDDVTGSQAPAQSETSAPGGIAEEEDGSLSSPDSLDASQDILLESPVEESGSVAAESDMDAAEEPVEHDPQTSDDFPLLDSEAEVESAEGGPLDPFDLRTMDSMPGREAGEALSDAVDRVIDEALDYTPEEVVTQGETEQMDGRVEPADEQTPLVEHPDVELQEESALQLDPELLVIYQQEVESHLNTVNSVLDSSRESHELAPNEALYRAIHTINGASRTADIKSIGELATLLEKPLKKILDQGVGLDEEVLELYQRGHDDIKRMATELVEQRRLPEMSEHLRKDLENLLEELDNHTVELETQDNQPSNQFLDTLTMMNEGGGPDYDDDLVEIFIEEATDLLEMSDHTLQAWVDQDEAEDEGQGFGLVAELQRYLHTLKGGAKMAEFEQISDLSHELESLFIAIIDGRVDKNDDLAHVLHDSFDLLTSQVEQIKNRQEMASSADQIEIVKRLRKGQPLHPGEPAADSALDEQSTPASAQVEFVLPEGVGEDRRHDEEHHRRQGDSALDDGRSSERDVVKVRSDLLDNLVNSAGEVSIYRARMEQQVSSFGSHLGELGQTIQRLKNQLRSLEAETDAQIHFSHRQEEKSAREFDPLEMDRYTQIQELSKSLGESVDDLSSLQALLGEQVKDSETLLLQQSRINTDLQDGLIRSRMVRFSGAVSRLRRLVRQTCSELAKKAELVVRGENNEVDVKVLDRMIAPLEHLVRNAISHGIESPMERVEKGKPETGQITIDVSRDGSDVIVRISDDGAGVNVEKVRKRAQEMGMLEEGRELEDNDLVQLILKPGFSTAEQVSQLSGRGVGMDVVDSSIKELGGALQISTSPEGSVFTARLPFTLSINQAILVKAGEESYALPLINIEGITRIESEMMSEFYSMEKPMIEYAGQQYALHYLSSLLDISHEFHVSNPMLKVPVILLRSGDLRIALHLDQIIGNREIVVKPLGRLLSQAKGLAGASILADGLVVLILDINGLIRHGVTTQVVVDEAEDEQQRGIGHKMVMVVDDSITMRRVATKLLTRNHYEVVTAKDGVDALAQLADHHPDVMLLDIEMPRMDGFELATHMKNDESLKDIPIIMITSRTGTKHRDHATSIGVDQYMGKPYQEEELIERIGALVG